MSIERLKEQYRLGVSSDLVGFGGKVAWVERFYRQIFKEESFGVEIIRTRGIRFDKEKVVGHHGRVGDHLIDNLLQSTDELVAEMRGGEAYLLLHTNEVIKHEVEKFKGNFLVVENSVGSDEIERLKKIKSEYGCEVVFDIVHVLLSGANWREVNKMLDGLGKCIVHVPIGENKADSFDPRLVAKRNLVSLGKILELNGCFVVIENQRKSMIDWMISDPNQDKDFLRETKEKIDILVECGVILG